MRYLSWSWCWRAPWRWGWQRCRLYLGERVEVAYGVGPLWVWFEERQR